jgi:hypothetical protein
MDIYRVIWKYEIDLYNPAQTFRMPPFSKIVHVDSQKPNTLQFWAEIPMPQDELVEREFVVVGTGHAIENPDLQYAGTAKDGEFIWHLYENTLIRIKS